MQERVGVCNQNFLKTLPIVAISEKLPIKRVLMHRLVVFFRNCDPVTSFVNSGAVRVTGIRLRLRLMLGLGLKLRLALEWGLRLGLK